MTMQEARVELKQIQTYYNRIAERKQRLAELRSAMGTIRISKYGNASTTRATSYDKYRLETVIDRVTKLEHQISDDILTMSEAQQRLVKKIELLSEPYSTVLSKRYIHLERFEKIAAEMNYTCEWVRHLDCAGVKKFSVL